MKQFISQRPHTGINLDKISNKYMNAHQTYRIPLFYLSEENYELEDIEDICFDIKDKGYQVEINHHACNLNDRDVYKVMELKGIEDPYTHFSHMPTMDSMMQMRYLGIDPLAAHKDKKWTYEKSFVKENLYLKITNKHEFTSIEKRFADNKILERTKNALDYELVTTKKMVDYEVKVDDEAQEAIDRCALLFEADDIEVRGWGSGIDVCFIKYIEIVEKI